MTNTLYTNDNLFVLTGLNSNLVDLIYLDPPFNSKRTYSAPVGSKAAGSSFKDMWTWEDVNEFYLETLAQNFPALARFIGTVGKMHSKEMMAYLIYMAQRIIEMHRVLKDTGSIYLHCDPTASHYLKIVLDNIFGKNNFRNEIVWRIGWVSGYKTQAKKLIRNHDIILYYTKSENFTFNKQYIPYEENYVRRDGKKPTGKGIPIEDTWNCSEIDQLNSIGIMSFSKEKTGYPTQKPLKLLERIIKTSSNEGDIILDPFCGCATTCVAAQHLNRKWIGIDIERNAVDILVDRLSDAANMFKDFTATEMIPARTDVEIVNLSKSEVRKAIKERLYKEQNGVCNGCGNNYLIKDFHIDHIIPDVKGGPSCYENFQLLCGHCNSIKGARPMEYLRMKIRVREKLLKEEIIFGE